MPLVSALTSPLTPSHFFAFLAAAGNGEGERGAFLLPSYPAQLHWGVNTGTRQSVCQEKGGLSTSDEEEKAEAAEREREGGHSLLACLPAPPDGGEAGCGGGDALKSEAIPLSLSRSLSPSLSCRKVLRCRKIGISIF